MFIRMDEQHHKKWLKRVRKSGISQADLFEKIVDNVMIVNINQFAGLMKELKYQGNNLNQLVRSIHTGEMIPHRDILEEMERIHIVYGRVLNAVMLSITGKEEGGDILSENK